MAEIHYRGASSVVYANPPDWNEMTAWARLLQPRALFIDVGSNVGVYTLWAAEHGAQVTAVEPAPDAYVRLLENLAMNEWRIDAINCALADRPGKMSFTSGLDTTNHLLLGAPDVRVGEVEVEVRTLDDVVNGRSVFGVKLDVEGAERLVLEGASATLARAGVSVFQIEWNDASENLLGEGREPVAQLLSHYGYTFYRPDAEGRLRPSDTSVGSDLFALAPGYKGSDNI